MEVFEPRKRAIGGLILSVVLGVLLYLHTPDDYGIIYTSLFFVALFTVMIIVFKRIDIRVADILFYVLVILGFVICKFLFY